MAFSKKNYSKDVSIGVTHALYPGVHFVFTFPKRMPQSALDAQGKLAGLTDAERAEEFRSALISAFAETISAEPEGFDFPTDERPLRERAKEYFDDPDFPELEEIVFSAWRAYKAAQLPAAYLKSGSDTSPASGLSPERA